MPRHLLSAKEIIGARDGDLFDGDGLIIRVRGPSVAAALRFTSPLTGSRREMGLGKLRRDSLAAAGASLTAVRTAAENARRELEQALDPIEERDREAQAPVIGEAQRPAAGSRLTLRRYVQAYHRDHVEPVRTPKHAQQWINSIEQHVPSTLLNSCIDRITAAELLDALVPILREVPETGSRISISAWPPCLMLP